MSKENEIDSDQVFVYENMRPRDDEIGCKLNLYGRKRRSLSKVKSYCFKLWMWVFEDRNEPCVHSLVG